MHPILHFRTITTHKMLVMKYCFRLGLYRQGLCHDLSKYGPTEFFVGAKYYRGTCSPNNAERKATGVSRAWLHHKGRNKHHFEYWTDYAVGTGPDGEGMALVGVKMPEKYVAEMFCDRLAASRVYRGDAYTDATPWEYYARFRGHYVMHPETVAQLEGALIALRDGGEDAAFAWVRRNLLRKR